MSGFETVLCTAWAVAAAGIAWYCITVGRRITYVTLADGQRQERRLPLPVRLLLPLTPNVAPFFGRTIFAAQREKLERSIIAAGLEGLLNAGDILALHVLMPLVFGVPWIFMIALAGHAADSAVFDKLDNLLFLLGPLWFAVYPYFWLRRAVAARHMSIRRALPFVLDLLTLSVEAGMDFMSALQRNLERDRMDALNEELIRVIREIQVGKTRREALRDLSRRVDLPDLRLVVNALVQADELGISIGSILRIQADQIRQRRFERAEKLANEAPVKMLFPLLIFIFPSVFLILLGPVVSRLIRQGF